VYTILANFANAQNKLHELALMAKIPPGGGPGLATEVHKIKIGPLPHIPRDFSGRYASKAGIAGVGSVRLFGGWRPGTKHILVGSFSVSVHDLAITAVAMPFAVVLSRILVRADLVVGEDD
jgi:hypothetical protein